MVKGYAWRFNTKIWQLGYRMYCYTEYSAVGFDALKSTIGGSGMWGFSEYVLVVADCIQPD